jgi:dTDP-glucose 4,6-dehydratase
MKILVTGGAGFIGSNFIRHIISKYPEHSVINLDKLTYAGNLENLKDLESFPQYKFIKGDICNEKFLNGLECDAIINFAAESHVDRSILNTYPFIQTNIIGTQNLLAYWKTHSASIIITRCSNNYGPFQFPEKLIPLLILNALLGKNIPVYGDGKNVRDWIHVTDHSKAIDTVFHRGKAGEIYNIGAKNEVENIELVKQILEIIAEKTGQNKDDLMKLIVYVKDRPGHDRRYSIDPSKIEGEIGWEPEVQFAEGLTQTVEWYISNRKWWEHIISGEYMDYYRTQYGEGL